MVARRRTRKADSITPPVKANTSSHKQSRPKAPSWFWTDEWQQKEREADADISEGKMEHFDSDEEFLAALERIHQECLRTRGQSDSGETSNR